MNAPLIRLDDLHFAYDPARPVLAGASFEVREGERLAVLGGNGSGKTTLLHLIVGLLTPQSGIIEAFGRRRGDEEAFREVRARAGLVFQDPDDQLFCPTVADDVAFGPLNLGKSRDEARAIVERTLAALGLAGFEERVTHKLSGGEKRLVSLASVLAMDPDVLLLDEPTNALDDRAEGRLLEILRDLPHAMVIVSHDRQFREHLADRSVLLDGGVITET